MGLSGTQKVFSSIIVLLKKEQALNPPGLTPHIADEGQTMTVETPAPFTNTLYLVSYFMVEQETHVFLGAGVVLLENPQDWLRKSTSVAPTYYGSY